MALTSIGDMAQHFMSLRNGTAVRTRLSQLTNEMSTGVAGDTTAHLHGRSDRLIDLDRRIALGQAQASATRALGQRLATAQVALEQVEGLRSDLSADLLGTPVSATAPTLAGASARADAAFAAVVSALNGRHGAESLFTGNATDRAALAPASDILAAVRGAVAGAADSADVVARVDAFFDDAGGGFETMAYLGDDGARAQRRIDGDQAVTLGPRADDPALRSVMKALALAALASDPALPLADAGRGDLLRGAGADLVGAADALAAVRGRLGADQESIDAAASRQSAALSATRILRNDLVAVDPAETASLLQQVKTQLEAQYTVTARLAGLTLAGFLR